MSPVHQERYYKKRNSVLPTRFTSLKWLLPNHKRYFPNHRKKYHNMPCALRDRRTHIKLCRNWCGCRTAPKFDIVKQRSCFPHPWDYYPSLRYLAPPSSWKPKQIHHPDALLTVSRHKLKSTTTFQCKIGTSRDRRKLSVENTWFHRNWRK